MQFILLNCTPKLKALGIDPTVNGWQDQLATKLATYATLDGWTYDYVSDTLIITPSPGASVSLNLTELGDPGGMTL